MPWRWINIVIESLAQIVWKNKTQKLSLMSRETTPGLKASLMFQMRLNGITRLKEQTAVLALALLVQVVPLLTVKLSIQIFSGWTLIICGMVVALTGGYQTFFHGIGKSRLLLLIATKGAMRKTVARTFSCINTIQSFAYWLQVDARKSIGARGGPITEGLEIQSVPLETNLKNPLKLTFNYLSISQLFY